MARIQEKAWNSFHKYGIAHPCGPHLTLCFLVGRGWLSFSSFWMNLKRNCLYMYLLILNDNDKSSKQIKRNKTEFSVSVGVSSNDQDLYLHAGCAVIHLVFPAGVCMWLHSEFLLRPVYTTLFKNENVTFDAFRPPVYMETEWKQRVLETGCRVEQKCSGLGLRVRTNTVFLETGGTVFHPCTNTWTLLAMAGSRELLVLLNRLHLTALLQQISSVYLLYRHVDQQRHISVIQSTQSLPHWSFCKYKHRQLVAWQ